VALYNDQVIATGMIDIEKGKLDAIFVYPNHMRMVRQWGQTRLIQCNQKNQWGLTPLITQHSPINTCVGSGQVLV